MLRGDGHGRGRGRSHHPPREFGGSDTYATSRDHCRRHRHLVWKDDIILAGRQAIDNDTAQVVPQIAEKLHLPQITCTTGEIKEDNTLTVKRILGMAT